jgi:hypothetical protein
LISRLPYPIATLAHSSSLLVKTTREFSSTENFNGSSLDPANCG